MTLGGFFMKRQRLYFKLKRMERGLSQEELAYDLFKKTGLSVSGSFIGQIERGERNPSLDTAIILARYFNTTVEKLFS